MGYSTKIMVRRRRVLVLGQLGVFEVPNATVHLLVSSVCLVFVRGPPKADDHPPKADQK
jgi:hypothetical protein